MATGSVTSGSAASNSMRKPCIVSKVFSASPGGVGGVEGNLSGSAAKAARLSSQKTLGVRMGDGGELVGGEFRLLKLQLSGFVIENGSVGAEAETLDRHV